MKYSVAHAQGGKGHWFHLNQPEPITLLEAIQASPLPGLYPELDLQQCKFGIFGKIHPATTQVKEGDRVEIYLPVRRRDKDDD